MRTARPHLSLAFVASSDPERTLDEHALLSLITESGWTREGDRLTKTYQLKGFKGAIRLVERIAEAANEMNHHPDIHIERYRLVRIVLTTHLIGGIRDADKTPGRRIDELAPPPRGPPARATSPVAHPSWCSPRSS